MKKLFMLCGVAIALSGCGIATTVGMGLGLDAIQSNASKTVTDAELADAAAFALDTTANNVKISNRQNKDGEIRFAATTRGKSRQCYVTVFKTGTLMNKTKISDAICSGAGSATGSTNCNALSKAAGRCK